MTWPEPAASVLEELEAQVRDLLGANLRGIYVYGSLAFECYNPARSDVDVLVVTRRRMAPETRRELVALVAAPPQDVFATAPDEDFLGIRHAPRRFRALIGEAAAIYAGERDGELDRDAVLAFVEWATDA